MGAPVAESVSMWYKHENIFTITKQSLPSVGILFNINSTKFYHFFHNFLEPLFYLRYFYVNTNSEIEYFLSFFSFFFLCLWLTPVVLKWGVCFCCNLSFVKYFLPKLLFHPLPLKSTIHECIQLSLITPNKANSTWEVLFHLPALLRREINWRSLFMDLLWAQWGSVVSKDLIYMFWNC